MLGLCYSCEKETIVSEIPEISFVSISPSVIQEFSDDILITIFYIDHNGDLGENNPDVKNLFVNDNRNDIKYNFRIPKLAPPGNNIAIQGNFDIEINGTGITDGSTSQSVSYSVYVEDRAGNKSNVITTSNIIVQQ